MRWLQRTLRPWCSAMAALPLLWPLACESKIRTKTVSGARIPEAASESAPEEAPPPATPAAATSKITPVMIPDGLDASRKHVQTRSPIVLDAKAQLVTPGSRIEVINETTKATLIDEQELDAPASLRFYPLDPNYPDRFAYGTNQLRLLVKDDTAPRSSRTTIERHDFSLFVTGAGTFDANLQRVDGLELLPGGYDQPAVSNGIGVLTVDPLSMMSR